MQGLTAFVRAYGMALVLGGLLVAAGCSGGNETPASFDPIEIALVRVEPGDGVSDVPRNTVVRMIFNTTVLPESVTDQSIIIRTGGTFQTRPIGTFLISGNIVEFNPTVTATGGANSLGFPAGAQIIVEVPLKEPADGVPAILFVQNVEGNPITIASGDNLLTFTTGSRWNDPVPGPPGVIGIDLTPGPLTPGGPVPADAAVTVIFDEPIDPSSVVLSENIFLTNNTSTAVIFQQDIPSVTFFDGSLTRYTFQPVFGFGQGPFSILMNFIDPDDPTSFNPVNLPTDLAGNQVQNFTFFATFATQFDPDVETTALLRENFQTLAQRDPLGTDAQWGDDAEVPFVLIGAPITQRTVNVDIRALMLFSGASSAINNAPTAPPSPPNEEDYCPTANPLVGPDLNVVIGNPPTSSGRRQQNLYRQGELGASGTVIRAAWGPDSDAVFAATYPDVIMYMGHKQAATSLAPGSFFAQFDVNGFVTVVNTTDYVVPQAADINGGMLNDGYLDWPAMESFFDYDGVNDLLLDIRAKEGNTFQTFRTFLSLSNFFGTCSCFNFFGCAPNNSIGLRQADTTYSGDSHNPPGSAAAGVANPAPFIHIMQFELAKLLSIATSFYYDSLDDDPDYLAPILNPVVQPGGSTLTLFWSGSDDGMMEVVPFTQNINDIDGHKYIRFMAIMRSNLFTKDRPRLNLIEIPVILRASGGN